MVSPHLLSPLDNRLKAPLATGMLGLELALIQPTLAL
jgi:hypothetical protein